MDVIISGKDLAIDWGWVRRELIKKEKIGAFDRNATAKTLQACIDTCLKKAHNLARPEACSVKRRVVSIGRNGVKLDKGIVLKGKKLSLCLKGAGHVRIFLVTIGDGIEHSATSLMHKGEHLHGYILDRIGSLAVESAAEGAERMFRERYESKGNSVSMRISPGYCDWPVEEQETLCRALDFSRIGVSLTGSFMMVPKKSISGLVGIGPRGRFVERVSPCSICKTTDCSYRR